MLFCLFLCLSLRLLCSAFIVVVFVVVVLFCCCFCSGTKA